MDQDSAQRGHAFCGNCGRDVTDEWAYLVSLVLDAWNTRTDIWCRPCFDKEQMRTQSPNSQQGSLRLMGDVPPRNPSPKPQSPSELYVNYDDAAVQQLDERVRRLEAYIAQLDTNRE